MSRSEDNMSNFEQENSVENRIDIQVRKVQQNKNKESKTTYSRPSRTFTDTIQTNDKMKKMLDGYIRVKDIDDEIKPNDHVRYVTIDANGKQAFRTGGFVVCVEDKFLMLTNRSIQWSVQRAHWKPDADKDNDEPFFKTVFFKKARMDDKLKQEKVLLIRDLHKLASFIRENGGNPENILGHKMPPKE